MCHTSAPWEYARSTIQSVCRNLGAFFLLRVAYESSACCCPDRWWLLPQAVTISDGDGIQESNEFLVLAPGDRVELVFDFSDLHDGDVVTLLNVGPTFDPFQGISFDGSLFGDTESAGHIPRLFHRGHLDRRRDRSAT